MLRDPNSAFFLRTADDMLNYFEGKFARRLVFSDTARSSFRKLFRRCRERRVLDEYFEVLDTLGAVMHPLRYVQRTDSLTSSFREMTGRQLAMTERRQTHRDSKLMRMRRVDWFGQPVDIRPHVKLKCRGHHRVYFGFHPTKSLIVVGYFGHLLTFGRKRRTKV